MIKLHQADMSSCSQKVRFVLEQKQLSWQSISVDLHNAENYSPEFKKLNPKAIIPVLIDGDELITESNNICLYLDEKYPQTPLMPSSSKGRSDVRTLLQLIDEQVHTDSSAATYAIAFRDRLQGTYDTPEKLEQYLQAMPDAGRRYLKRQLITKGMESKEFEIAILRLAATVNHLDSLLQNSDFLVDDQLSIADIAYSPYITRLDHLAMGNLWDQKPAVAEWYERIKQTSGYQQGLSAKFNQDAINNMTTQGELAFEKVQAILSEA